jgi:hypothetical protein
VLELPFWPLGGRSGCPAIIVIVTGLKKKKTQRDSRKRKEGIEALKNAMAVFSLASRCVKDNKMMSCARWLVTASGYMYYRVFATADL